MSEQEDFSEYSEWAKTDLDFENYVNDLTDLIYDKIIADFNYMYLSKNLINTTIKSALTPKADGYEKSIKIPAMRYDIHEYINNGIIRYTHDGSYAQEVNITGGFSGKHKDYIERAIIEAVQEIIAIHGLQAEVEII